MMPTPLPASAKALIAVKGGTEAPSSKTSKMRGPAVSLLAAVKYVSAKNSRTSTPVPAGTGKLQVGLATPEGAQRSSCKTAGGTYVGTVGPSVTGVVTAKRLPQLLQ